MKLAASVVLIFFCFFQKAPDVNGEMDEMESKR